MDTLNCIVLFAALCLFSKVAFYLNLCDIPEVAGLDAVHSRHCLNGFLSNAHAGNSPI